MVAQLYLTVHTRPIGMWNGLSQDAALLPPVVCTEDDGSVELPPTKISILQVVDVEDLRWTEIREAINPAKLRALMHSIVPKFETALDAEGGPGLMFDEYRTHPTDKAIQVTAFEGDKPLWFIGDLHGDWLALEAALALIAQRSPVGDPSPGIIFLGDLFDDEGYGLEVVLRLFTLMLEAPNRICIVAGNHDEALGFDGARFTSSVDPSDFSEMLNDNLAHEWIVRAGKAAIRLFERAPRAVFLPDGLLVAHGGVPLVDLHAGLAATGNWNDPACLADFVWTRAHPTSRRKIPNRYSRGSQFGYEDFADFCQLATSLGRPVTHMVRGHDHVEERYSVPAAYSKYPLLTTVALSRRLLREHSGPYERVPTIARYVPGVLPEIIRLHIPAELIREVYPQPVVEALFDPGAIQ